MRIVLKTFLLAISLIGLAASAQTYTSGVKQVTLVELYTSEGCSSCPPADRWLQKLTDNSDLWKNIVPVAFHVDYWNKLGWKDRFSSPLYSERQRNHLRQGGVSAVYTPGFIVNGSEWRGWFRNKRSIPQSKTAPGVLELSVDDLTAAATFAPLGTHTKKLNLNIAILGMDLSSKVTRGENHGRILSHDFVVLHFNSYSEISRFNWQTNLPELPPNAQYAIAAWVSEENKLSPIQAVGGLLH